MQYKIGIVRSFDGFVGRIIANGKEYIFLDIDVKDTIKEGDLVKFRDEKERAFFVEKLEKKDIKILIKK